jgi:ribonuclease HII
MLRRGHDAVIGVDEVGMGCLAGPVIVCAVLLRDSSYDDLGAIEGVSDSKLLTSRRREALARKLTTSPAVAFALAAVHPSTIDRINIFQAARRGMRRAIAKVLAGTGATTR